MACMSPVRFNWFLCTITERVGDYFYYVVFNCKNRRICTNHLNGNLKSIPHTHTSPFTFSPYNSTLAYTNKISLFPLQFNKLLEENLSKSPSFSQLLPVVIPSWYHTIPSVPIIRDVKWKSPWYINPLTSRTTVSCSCSNFKVLLTLIFLELISKTNTFGADLKFIGCVSADEQSGHFL